MSAIPTLIQMVPHTTARAADVNANFAALLAMMDPSSGPDGGVDGANMQHGTPGQLWVADGTGIYQQKSMGGDASMTAAGALVIGDGKVTSRKLSPAAGERVSRDLHAIVGDGTVNTPNDLDNANLTLSITPAVDSILFVNMVAEIRIDNPTSSPKSGLLVYLVVDGTRQPDELSFVFSGEVGAHPAYLQNTAAMTYAIPLDHSAHTIKVQKAKYATSSDTVVYAQSCMYTYLLVAS